MHLESCMPVIPSADLEKSLRFWFEGLGLTMDRAMRRDGLLIGCMAHDEQLYFWLNERAGAPTAPDDYDGQTEFFVTDDDGHSHCFGVPTLGERRISDDERVARHPAHRA